MPAAERKIVLELLGSLSAGEHGNAGYLIRTRLASISAKEMPQLIEPCMDLKASAQAMLTYGLAALQGRFLPKNLQEENGEFHTKVIDQFQFGESAFVSAYAGMATFSTVNSILYDTNLDVAGIHEKDTPPDDWDASDYASLAVSGSAVWEKKGMRKSLRHIGDVI